MESVVNIDVLLVEDNDGDARFLQELLKEPSDATFSITRASRLATALESLKERSCDLVLLDLTLPDARGLETVIRIRKAAPNLPIVVLTGLDDEQFALKAVREGAQDYLVKGRIEPDLLVRAIRYAIERQELQLLQVRLEQQLRQFQKMEAIGQVASGVAHDFNNYLSIIQGHVQALIRRNPPPEFANSLQQVANAADSASELTKQLLMISRQQVIEQRVVDLSDILKKLADLLTGIIGQSIELKLEPSPDLPPVFADPGMIEQIILNLAVNARDAMPGGGTLTLAGERAILTGETSNPPPHASQREAGGIFACIRVSDTGCGIDPATLNRIFEPFFSTKPAGKGTGLGLATVYGIVNQHRGWIDVQSEIGLGTVFKIFIPAADSQGKSHASPKGAKHVEKRGSPTGINKS